MRRKRSRCSAKVGLARISFKSEETGANFRLEPATRADMRGESAAARKSLEVIYDKV